MDHPSHGPPRGQRNDKGVACRTRIGWVCGQQGPEPLDTVLCWGAGLRPGFSKRLKNSVVVPRQEAADAVHWGACSESLVSWS